MQQKTSWVTKLILVLMITAFFGPMLLAVIAAPEIMQKTLSASALSAPLSGVLVFGIITFMAMLNFNPDNLRKLLSAENKANVAIVMSTPAKFFYGFSLSLTLLSMFGVGWTAATLFTGAVNAVL